MTKAWEDFKLWLEIVSGLGGFVLMLGGIGATICLALLGFGLV